MFILPGNTLVLRSSEGTSTLQQELVYTYSTALEHKFIHAPETAWGTPTNFSTLD
jgi:hypothetical protein